MFAFSILEKYKYLFSKGENMRKSIQKITAIILVTALSTEAYAFTSKPNEHVIIGTPEQIENTLYNNFQKVVPNSHFEEIDEKEELKIAVSITADGNIQTDVPYIFSQNFDNKEGSVIDKNSIKKLLWTLMDKRFYEPYVKARTKFASYLPPELKTKKQMNELFRNALEISDSIVKGNVEGYACPMGGSPSKNKLLSLSRANNLKQVVMEALRDWFITRFNYEPDLQQLNSKIIAIGKGSVYKHQRVKNVVDRLNQKGYKIDYKKIAAENEQEIVKLDRAMKHLKSINPTEFESLKKHMDPLRKAVLTLYVAVDAKIYIVPIIVVETGVVPGVIPEQWKIEEARKKALLEANEVMRPVVNYIRNRRPNIPRQPRGARGAFGVK